VTIDTSGETIDVRFESALKYVEILLIHNGSGDSRIEATSILTWLGTCKQVDRIFEVHVEDFLHSPHSEENIEHALQGFDVRDLDWRRVDLSVCSILEAAPNVEYLYLYSSGNPAVIDHWLGPNGVCTLLMVSDMEQYAFTALLTPAFNEALLLVLDKLLIPAQLKELVITIITVGLSRTFEDPLLIEAG
jgi:hypothetical protein